METRHVTHSVWTATFWSLIHLAHAYPGCLSCIWSSRKMWRTNRIMQLKLNPNKANTLTGEHLLANRYSFLIKIHSDQGAFIWEEIFLWNRHRSAYRRITVVWWHACCVDWNSSMRSWWKAGCCGLGRRECHPAHCSSCLQGDWHRWQLQILQHSEFVSNHRYTLQYVPD